MIWWTSEGWTTQFVSYLSGYLWVGAWFRRLRWQFVLATKLICRECGYIMKDQGRHLQQFSKAFPKIYINKVVCYLKLINWWKEVSLQGRRIHALHQLYDIMIQYAWVACLLSCICFKPVTSWLDECTTWLAWMPDHVTTDEYNKHLLPGVS